MGGGTGVGVGIGVGVAVGWGVGVGSGVAVGTGELVGIRLTAVAVKSGVVIWLGVCTIGLELSAGETGVVSPTHPLKRETSRVNRTKVASRENFIFLGITKLLQSLKGV
ncbi:MAG: hypothetical protein JWP00_4858 [Chloroflexi bacterium]|nr:hypothetical protein [Chloroflexota bacterium]